MAKERQRLQRRDFPPGRSGQILKADPLAPGGVRWEELRLSDCTDLPGLHPGSNSPLGSSGLWQPINTTGSGFGVEWGVPSVGVPWVPTGAPYEDPQWRIDPMGMLRMKGNVMKVDSTAELLGSPVFVFGPELRVSAPVNAAVAHEWPCSSTIPAGRITVAMVLWGLEHGTLPGHLRYAFSNASVDTLDLSPISFLIDADT